MVVSGGQGSDEIIAEALAMKRYLLSMGLADDRIIMEDRSTTTYENFKYSKEILDEKFSHDYTTVYVTNDFHVYRAGLYAGDVGLNGEGLASATPFFLLPSNYTREYCAVLWYFLVGSR